MSTATYEIESFPVGSFQCNCAILGHAATREAMVVDPGDEAEMILERLESNGWTVRAIWHTHAHIDHIGATQAVYDACCQHNRDAGKAAPQLYLHEGDRWLYENVKIQAQFLRLHAPDVPSNWKGIEHNQTYEGFAGVRALHTPGHTPGSCCLDIKGGSTLEVPRSFRVGSEGDAPRVLLTGDTLFRQSIGRTDLWGGDGALIVKSIKAKLLGLPEDTLVLPGHGPLTTVGAEKDRNPFLKGNS